LHGTTHHAIEVYFSGKHIVDEQTQAVCVSGVTLSVARCTAIGKCIATDSRVGRSYEWHGFPFGKPFTIA
jgi:hypothetical protein